MFLRCSEICLIAAAENSLQRNTLIHICQLPSEILSLIFITYAKSNNVRYHLHHPLNWIRISHVCRRFRAVALESPTLWSDISLKSLQIAREMLTRSKGAELALSSRTLGHGPTARYGQAFVAAVKETLVEMHRIRTIELLSLSDSALDAVVAGLEVEAPRLEYLGLRKTPHAFRPNTRANYYSLPSNFMCGGAPRLRHLKLVDCVLPWWHWQRVEPNCFNPCLTTLELAETSSLPPFMSGQRPSLSQLVHLLEASPALRRLELQNMLPIAASTLAAVAFPTRLVSLPQLDELRLVGTYLEMIGVIRTVSFPKTTKVTFVGDSQNEWLDACSTLMHTLSECRGSVFEPEKIEVHRFDPSCPSFWISVWDKVDQSTSSKTRRPRPSFSMNIRYDRQFPVPSLSTIDMFRSIFDDMDFSQLRSLEVSSRAFWDLPVWGCFGNAPNLTHICASMESVKGLAQAMIPRLAIGSREQVRSEMFFRDLQNLTLEQANFRGDDLDVEMFTDTLMLRAAYGSDLRELCIRQAARITKLDVELIEEIVSVVAWDGANRDHEEVIE